MSAYTVVCTKWKMRSMRAVLVCLLVAVAGGAAGQTAGNGGSAQAAAPAGGDKAKTPANSGPTEIIVLPLVPVLDEEGRQRLDPDGKPMFYPQERQQRDKKGRPRFDEDGRPVMQTPTELGYDENGKKIKPEKEKAPKGRPVTISRGTFTVDGVIGKVALNYDIANLRYLYLYVPGMGVTVVSDAPFDGAREQKEAFNGKSLTVTVDGHALEVASERPLLGERPESAFVRLDREFVLPSPYPQVGYGVVLTRPYGWPGSKANAAVPTTGLVQAPAIPANLLPEPPPPPCPAGQVRNDTAARLPGQTEAAGSLRADYAGAEVGREICETQESGGLRRTQGPPHLRGCSRELRRTIYLARSTSRRRAALPRRPRR